jgi:hypothetical protein
MRLFDTKLKKMTATRNFSRRGHRYLWFIFFWGKPSGRSKRNGEYCVPRLRSGTSGEAPAR